MKHDEDQKMKKTFKLHYEIGTTTVTCYELRYSNIHVNIIELDMKLSAQFFRTTETH